MKGVFNRFGGYHNRRSIRLKGYDYSRPGAYFITLNIHPQANLIFGNIVWATGESPQAGDPTKSNSPRMELNEFGQFVQEEWERSFEIRNELQKDAYQIMPDHFHAIVIIRDQDKSGHQDRGTEDRRIFLKPGEDDTPVARTKVVQQIPEQSNLGLGVDGKGPGILTNFDEKNPLGSNTVVTEESYESLNAWTGTEDLIGANDRLWISNRPKGARARSIGALIAGFKASTIKRINAARNTPGKRVWQRDYYERIIRNERALYFIRQYIKNNPLKWSIKRENPNTQKIICIP